MQRGPARRAVLPSGDHTAGRRYAPRVIDVSVAPAEPSAVRTLADRAERADGFPSLGEPTWRDLTAPTADSFDVRGVDDRGRLVAFLHAHAGDSRSRPHRALGVVVDPEHRDPELVRELIATALAEVAPSEDVILWLPGKPRDTTAGAEAAGMHVQRALRRMEVPLPIPYEPVWPDETRPRTFRVGADEEAWLTANDRAFAGHPEQSGWDLATLRRRFAEHWFDPEGFLLAFDHDGLAGFCWTKEHPHGVGEIFVIGVDPDRQRAGLGRALVVAGLASLAERGSTRGMLYVDAANTAAVELYEKLGFRAVRTDVAYLREGAAGA